MPKKFQPVTFLAIVKRTTLRNWSRTLNLSSTNLLNRKFTVKATKETLGLHP